MSELFDGYIPEGNRSNRVERDVFKYLEWVIADRKDADAVEQHISHLFEGSGLYGKLTTCRAPYIVAWKALESAKIGEFEFACEDNRVAVKSLKDWVYQAELNATDLEGVVDEALDSTTS